MQRATVFTFVAFVLFSSSAIASEPNPAAAVRDLAEREKGRVVTFFGAPFPREVETKILPSRAAFDEHFAQWEPGAKTECWMVATGASKGIAVLALDRWSSEACEHDASDSEHVRGIIAHELVHVYHAQKSPSRDFVGMDDLGWFIEGLAVYASGQLEAKHAGAARAALEAGKGPVDLASAWSGRYRYGVCGSLVAYVDKTFGRDTTLQLLTVTTQSDALKILGLTESQLLERWRTSVTSEGGHPVRPTT